MNHGTEQGRDRIGAPGCPVLVECDKKGRIIWMSDAARSRLGDAETLVGTILAPRPGSQPSSSVECLCVAREVTLKNSLVMSLTVCISPENAGQERPAKEGAALGDLERGLLLHYFRLQEAERTLSVRVRRTRRHSGTSAIRQLELERQRLGRELHTGVGQSLAAIRLQLEIVAGQVPPPPAGVQQAIERIGTLASDALDQVRNVSRRLHPPEWQRLKLEEALTQLWELSGIPQLYQARSSIQALGREPGLEIKVLLYRAAQEALSNLAHHARATRIEMTMEADGGTLRLTIRDNGKGFDVAALFSAPASVASGIGLRSIREQAEGLGGKMEIESGASGTTLSVSAPYEAAERKA